MKIVFSLVVRAGVVYSLAERGLPAQLLARQGMHRPATSPDGLRAACECHRMRSSANGSNSPHRPENIADSLRNNARERHGAASYNGITSSCRIPGTTIDGPSISATDIPQVSEVMSVDILSEAVAIGLTNACGIDTSEQTREASRLSTSRLGDIFSPEDH